jgi:hypothetical protein
MKYYKLVYSGDPNNPVQSDSYEYEVPERWPSTRRIVKVTHNDVIQFHTLMQAREQWNDLIARGYNQMPV